MVNILVAPTDRRGGRVSYGRRRRGDRLVRPYISGGFGVMAERVSTRPVDVLSNEHLGVDAGVGIMALPYGGFGVRTTRATCGSRRHRPQQLDRHDFGSFHFWRASIGVVGAF